MSTTTTAWIEAFVLETSHNITTQTATAKNTQEKTTRTVPVNPMLDAWIDAMGSCATVRPTG